jgi:hypothetical protein
MIVNLQIVFFFNFVILWEINKSGETFMKKLIFMLAFMQISRSYAIEAMHTCYNSDLTLQIEINLETTTDPNENPRDGWIFIARPKAQYFDAKNSVKFDMKYDAKKDVVNVNVSQVTKNGVQLIIGSFQQNGHGDFVLKQGNIVKESLRLFCRQK